MDWEDYSGLDVTATFRGVTTPLPTLIAEIAKQGWTADKCEFNNGAFEAEGMSPHGEKLLGRGKTPQTAMAQLLMRCMRQEFMRAPRVASWQTSWETQLPEIAQAYAEAPIYDASAAPAWMELASDSMRRAEALQTQVKIEIIDDPVPYKTVQELCEDVHKNRHIFVSRADADHPVWSPDEVVAYRLVHDVMGHCVTGGDFGWHGENRATAAHMPLVSPAAQKALFTEALGHSAYTTFYRGYGPKKVAFLDDYIEDAQEAENSPDHAGTHPSQTVAPTLPPSFAKVAAETGTRLLQRAQEHEARFGPDRSEVVHQFPDGWSIRRPTTYGDYLREGQLMGNCWSPLNEYETPYPWDAHPLAPNDADWPQTEADLSLAHVDHPLPNDPAIGLSLRDPTNLPHVSFFQTEPHHLRDIYGRHNDNPKPEYTERLRQWAPTAGITHIEGRPIEQAWPPRVSYVAAVNESAADPNHGWSSGIVPLADNAYMWYDDPLGINKPGGVLDTAAKIDTGWANHVQPDGTPDSDTHRQAVMNALRAAVLSPHKDPKWHAIHYQHLLGVPPTVTDPVRYDDALEGQREAHNQAHGYAPGAHKAWWKAEQDFTAYVLSMHPEMRPEQVQATAKREMFHIWHDEEERLTGENPDMSADDLEQKVGKEVAKALTIMTKPGSNDTTDHVAAATEMRGGLYGGWLKGHLKTIARLAQHADRLTDAAKKDVEHGGKGHHWRNSVLNLDVPGVGAREASYAWLLLQPRTSQLANVDPHVLEALGHQPDDAHRRDYYKHERELGALKDATGYNYIPLGAFSWGVFDHKRGGPGFHDDQSPLRVLNPLSHEHIDWDSKSVPAAKWQEPPWWTATQPARDLVANHWDENVAAQTPSHEIPEVAPNVKTAAMARVPYYMGPEGEVAGHAGQSLMEHMKNSLGLTTEEVWGRDLEMGKR